MRHNDSCLKIFSTRSFPSQSTQRPWKLTYLFSQWPTAKVWTSPSPLTIITQPFNCHKHIYKPPVGWGQPGAEEIPFRDKENMLYFPLKLFPQMPRDGLVAHVGLKNEPLKNGWIGIRLTAPIQGRDRVGAAVSRRIYMVPQKGLQNQILKGLLQINYRASKRRWLILNVEFEVFSFSVNACLRR